MTNIHYCKTTNKYVVRVVKDNKQKFVSRDNTLEEAKASQKAYIKALEYMGVVCHVSGKKPK